VKPMLIAHMQCAPYACGDGPAASVPRVSVQLLDDLWVKGLDPAGVVETAEKFRRFADLLVTTVAPALFAARGDWAAHVPARPAQADPQI